LHFATLLTFCGSESARGQAHSKTLRAIMSARDFAAASWTAPVLWRFYFLLNRPTPAHPSAMPEPKTPWPHAPTHQLAQRGTYFLTASTHRKEHHFRGAKRLSVLHRGLLVVAEQFGWKLEAWAVFSNHYHFVGHSPADAPDATSLPAMLSTLHVKTAGWVNKLDGRHGRQVWFNFRDTKLTHQRSYLARLNYVHQNAVKHGLVSVASQYPWCSAGWLERTASPAMVKSIYRFKTDRVSVEDDFEPTPEW
jgi:putative transposase